MPSVHLRELFRFEQKAAEANGVRSGPWELLTTEPADLLGLKGGEEVMAARLEGDQPIQLTVRYHQLSALIDSSCRAIDARPLDQGGTGFTFNIKSAVARPRHDFIDILAVRKLGGTVG
jgi:hypothetical protein